MCSQRATADQELRWKEVVQKLQKELKDEKESSEESLREQRKSDSAAREILEDHFKEWRRVSEENLY